MLIVLQVRVSNLMLNWIDCLCCWVLFVLVILVVVGCVCIELGIIIVCFWVMGCEVEVVSELIYEFEVENFGIKVDVQNILWIVVYEKLLIVFVVDGLLDVCQFGNIWVLEFVEFDVFILL